MCRGTTRRNDAQHSVEGMLCIRWQHSDSNDRSAVHITGPGCVGDGPLPAGHYTELRLVVSGAAIYFDNPTSGTAWAPTVVAPAGRSAVRERPAESRVRHQ